MSDHDVLAAQFEECRSHLRAVARRMLGSGRDADEAVHETWIRLSRSGPPDVDNLGGWLTAAVARVCLDRQRSRRSQREESVGMRASDPIGNGNVGIDVEAELANSVGPALLVVLEALTPAERLAFLLHDMFALRFDAIARIVGCSPGAAEQFASHARRRVHGAVGSANSGPDVAS